MDIRFECTSEHEKSFIHFKTTSPGVIEAAVTGM
jgi:hypothetical protein